MSEVYHGKHRHAEIAEFVSVAMAVWDRQHGNSSISWEFLSSRNKANAVARVMAYEQERPEAQNPREVIEFMLYEALLPPKAPVAEETPEQSEPVAPPTTQDETPKPRIIR